MGHPHTTRTLRRGWAVALGCWFAWTAALAAEPPTMEQFKKDLLTAQNHLSNISMKVRHGLSGMSGSSGSAGKPNRAPTPAEACCASNIKTIKEAINNMTVAIEHWGLIYAEQQNSEALSRLGQMRAQLGEVSQGLAIFNMAGSVDRAVYAYQGIVRPFNEVRALAESIEACCPLKVMMSDDEAPADAEAKEAPEKQ